MTLGRLGIFGGFKRGCLLPQNSTRGVCGVRIWFVTSLRGEWALSVTEIRVRYFFNEL